MKVSSLVRLSGLAGFLSAIFIVLEQVLPQGMMSGIAGLFSPLLGLFVLTGLYVHQRKAIGQLGGAGYIVSSLGLALVVGMAFPSAFLFPFMDAETVRTVVAGPTGPIFLLIALIFLVGFLMFSISILRAGVLPRWAPILMIVGYLPMAVKPFMPHSVLLLSAVLFGAGMAWISMPLWTNARVSAPSAESQA